MWQRVNTIMGAVSGPDLDAQLMLRVRDGDEDSFRVLLEKHRNPLVHFLYRMVQEQAVSEELAQEVFLRIYRSRGVMSRRREFTTWMFRIATHLALNWLRDEKNERAQERLDADRAESAGPRSCRTGSPRWSSAWFFRPGCRKFRDAIAWLPEKQRAAVLMHKYEEMEYSQIASVLECSESAVKSLLFRAYETLRARLAHMVPGGPR